MGERESKTATFGIVVLTARNLLNKNSRSSHVNQRQNLVNLSNVKISPETDSRRKKCMETKKICEILIDSQRIIDLSVQMDTIWPYYT